MSIEERDVMFKSGETFAAAWLFLPENGALGARVPAVAMAHGPALTLFAPHPRARGARRAKRRWSAERPTFRWSAERPAIRPTRWRRLGGASAISFLGRTMGSSGLRRTILSATHIQVVSRATRDQADPLAPAGRRFGNFVFGARTMELGRSRRTIDHAAAAGRAARFSYRVIENGRH